MAGVDISNRLLVTDEPEENIKLCFFESVLNIIPDERDTLIEILTRHKETGSVMEPRGLFTFNHDGKEHQGAVWDDGEVTSKFASCGFINYKSMDLLLKGNPSITNIKFASPPT